MASPRRDALSDREAYSALGGQMGILHRTLMSHRLASSFDKGALVAHTWAAIYDSVIEGKPPAFSEYEPLCQYTAGWICGSILASAIAREGKPGDDSAAKTYDELAFRTTVSVCDELAFMRGITFEALVGPLRSTPEFWRGYNEAYKELVRMLSGAVEFFPVGFSGYTSIQPIPTAQPNLPTQ